MGEHVPKWCHSCGVDLAGYSRGCAEERAAIVAFLRANLSEEYCGETIDVIEAGKYLSKGEL